MPRISRPDDASVWGPMREWWVLNPGPRLDICLNEGIYDFVFHQKTYLFKTNMRLSPTKHMNALAQNYPWRSMLIDYHNSLAVLYTNEVGWSAPVGVFPMWSAHRDTASLMKMLDQYPETGDEVGWFTGAGAPAVAQPGQERRILIYGFPKRMAAWEGIFRDLMEAKRAHPDIIFHLHGQKSIPRTLATGVDSFDHPVTIDWQNDQPRLLLANGSVLDHEAYKKSDDHRKWARLVGVDVRSIFDQEDRVRKSRRMYTFNLRSLKWSFTNYDRVWSMKVVDESDVDVDDPDSSWVPVDLRYKPRTTEITDKWLCDLCSISHRCPFFRPGAICIVDDSEAKELATNFKSRNARDITDALGSLLAAQGTRAAEALKAEKEHNDTAETPKFSSEVTKMLALLFDQGVTLARLIDPHLGVGMQRGGRGKVISATAHEVGQSNPAELASEFYKQVELMGYNINDLTPDDAKEVLARLVPSGTMPPDVDDDDDPHAIPSGGNAVAPGAPPLRAAPSFNP